MIFVLELNIAYELYKKIKVRFSEANFNVRKWTSNDKTLMKLINRDELISNKINTKDSSNENLKVLGIIWEPIKDNLNLGVCYIFEKAAILALKETFCKVSPAFMILSV